MMPFFERVGVLYVGGMLLPSWSQFKRPDARQALQLFLGSYAFERAGASPDYAPAATTALAHTDAELDPQLVWTNFRQIVDGPTNPKLNPLYHRRSKSCTCAFCVLQDGDRTANLVTGTRDQLRKNHVALAHETLTEIRGIGPKIASFFLRDVALRYKIEPDTDRHLLQPVDLWIRRFAQILDAGLEGSTSAVAEWMVRNSIRPELANAGMWYFGARIAPRRLVYERALRDPRYAKKLTEAHVARLAGAADAWRLLPNRSV